MNKLWLLYRLHRLGFRARPEPAFVAQLEERLFGKPSAVRSLMPQFAGAGLALVVVVGSYLALPPEKAIAPTETSLYAASLDELLWESHAFPDDEFIIDRLAYEKASQELSDETEEPSTSEIDELMQVEL